ncbi:MAG TPA: hypothetical protein VMV10_31465 [Pirellulales bacterium]|nr:hypothetical protein [Pirellulales bacterium]
MGEFVRNVNEIDSADRQAVEHLLGQPLRENQKLVIRVLAVEADQQASVEPQPSAGETASLPDWCNVYEGLSEEEIAELKRTVLMRADLSRPTD